LVNCFALVVDKCGPKFYYTTKMIRRNTAKDWQDHPFGDS